jgi:two-component system chemotaxis sensor kinase CheA
MDDLIVEFIAETQESLGQIDNDLITLEQNPNDKGIIGNIFRLMHTIKGTCGFLGLGRLEKLAHHSENVMGRFRDGDLEVKQEYVSLILESIDQIKFMIDTLETTGAEPEGNDAELIERIDAVYEGRDGASSTSEATAEELSTVRKEENEGGLSEAELKALEDAFNNAESPEEMAAREAKEKEEAEKAAQAPAVKEGTAPTAPVAAPVQSLRVNVDVLENLMTMVSELVLTRNQLIQIMRSSKDTQFDAPLQRLNHVVSDLQEGVMKTRMQPVGNAWGKLPRIIRDISIELGKKIDLQMIGQETELDRQVLDLIKDPLTHMVRNSADHGIEKPEDRAAAGKPETGTIILNAYHEGGHIIMEIKDDGKGLNTARIREKALENGIATEEELETMTPKQINQFIFAAGFSTAAEVTAVSGRGVGMDVVRTNIEKIGGTIDLDSVEGEGTTVSIKIPLTLAIVSALIVASKGEKFAIPQLAVQELVMGSSGGENKIEMINGAPVYRLRDHLLPLIYLNDLLGLGSKDDEIPVEGEPVAVNDNQYIVVTKVGAYSFGIVVDRVYDTEEIVVKPVASILKNIELFSGNTILGDGTVIMILDPGGIARSSGEISMSDTVEKKPEAVKNKGLQKTSLILFESSDGAPKAVPLQLVSRLEDVDVSKIEHSNGKMMIQYRDSLMPLVKFDDQLQLNEGRTQPTLVFSDGRRTMGLMVKNIIDIMEDYINVQVNSENDSCLGSAIINGQATDVISVGYHLGRAYKDWFSDHGFEDFSDDAKNMDVQKQVLIVDDSPFFRNMLAPILGVAGYNVTTADHPLEAIEYLEKGHNFDIIVSDIEMPEMNGYQFAEKIKENPKWSKIPMVALTSHTTEKDIIRGKEVGFEEYIAKFDRETLLTALSDTLRNAQDLDKIGAA